MVVGRIALFNMRKGNMMIKQSLFRFVFIAVNAALPFTVDAADLSSSYVSLSGDQYVSGSATLLTTTVTVSSAGWAYLQSDGRYFPYGGGTLANAYIAVDGVQASNDSLIEWRDSTDVAQHSFNVTGASYLTAGTHTIALKASTTGGVYYGASTNLSVLTQAASNVNNVALGADTNQLTFNNDGVNEGSPLVSYATILQSTVSTTGAPVVAFASGRSYVWGNYGDALWGLYWDGQEPNIDSMTWTDNDMWTGAEIHAPMFSQGFFNASSGTHTVSLVASDSPYTGNGVAYRIGANARLITLSGGMTVYGKALNSNSALYGPYKRASYICIGTNGSNPGCPAEGTEVVIAQGTVYIPSTHNGVVMFSAKSRVQGDSADQGGNVFLYLKLDGNLVGSYGVQQLNYPDCESTRTISASYLAAGNNRLSPGYHTIRVVGRADGNYHNLSLVADLPVIWFD
jgi:hypothetical protein